MPMDGLEGSGVAEKAGQVDGQRVQEGAVLRRVVAKQLAVLLPLQYGRQVNLMNRL
jgi:hypothetical protein